MKNKILNVEQFGLDKKLHKPTGEGAIYQMHCVFFDEEERVPYFFTLEQLKMLAHKLKLTFQNPSDLSGKDLDPDLFNTVSMDVITSSKTAIHFIDPVNPSFVAGCDTIEINNQYDFKDTAVKTKLLKEGIELLKVQYGDSLFRECIPFSTYNDDATAALYAHLMQLKGLTLVPIP
jgi:hypothetical protein